MTPSEIIVAVTFLTLIVGLPRIFYRLSNWYKMNQKYPAPTTAQGETIDWTSLAINQGVSYKRSISITISPIGLYIVPMSFLKIAKHQPFLVPWTDIKSIERKSFPQGTYGEITLIDGTTLSVSNDVKNAIETSGFAAEKMK